MKKLILGALLALSINAYADTVAIMENNAGGLMHFTDAACPSKNNPYWKIIYSITKTGQSVYGCWIYADKMVHVQWDSGNTSAFYATDLTILKEEKKGKSYAY